MGRETGMVADRGVSRDDVGYLLAKCHIRRPGLRVRSVSLDGGGCQHDSPGVEKIYDLTSQISFMVVRSMMTEETYTLLSLLRSLMPRASASRRSSRFFSMTARKASA